MNGMAAHALDYDDVALLGHPSAVLVPAIVAEAEERDVPGTAMIVAYVVGYEVWAELLSREGRGYRAKGWHPTAMFGTVAAAAACASLRGLSAGTTAHALGIAASYASGVAANFGSMTKALHVGKAAQSGILAARLAENGFTASADVLEHPQGFLSAISPSGDPDRDTPANQLGRRWRIVERGLSVKRYPVCYAAHRLIDAMLDLCARSPFDASEVRRIQPFMSRAQDVMLRYKKPQSALEAKFSAESAMAAAVIAGQVGLNEVSDAFVLSAQVQTLMQRVGRKVHEIYDPELPDYAPFDHVSVQLANGAVLNSERIRRPRGHVSNPLTKVELRTKFMDCVSSAISPAIAEFLFDSLQNLPSLPSAKRLAIT